MSPKKVELRNLIIVVPGIIGSVLRKKDKIIWGLSASKFYRAITSKKEFTNDLYLEKDSEVYDDIDDNVVATDLIKIPQMIAKFKNVGYQGLGKRIKESFKGVISGHIDKPQIAANYIEFPYDWRRTNVYTANKLKRFVDKRLKLLIDSDKNKYKGAGVILIAHSMGGLISRYYLEVLGGREDCKALFTLGTPHWGSLNALDALSNGYRLKHIDLSDTVRSFNSAYELLPTSYCFENGGKYHRLDTVHNLNNINQEKLAKAFKFHQNIENAISRNKENKKYDLFPVVGVSQLTYQSAKIKDDRVYLLDKLEGVDSEHINDGDGTVPRMSAIPKELHGTRNYDYTKTLHASIPNDEYVMDTIVEHITMVQIGGSPHYRGSDRIYPSLLLRVSDTYLADNNIIFFIDIVNADNTNLDLKLNISLVESSGNTEKVQSAHIGNNDIGKLHPGFYQVTIFNRSIGVKIPSPLTDYFMVI